MIPLSTEFAIREVRETCLGVSLGRVVSGSRTIGPFFFSCVDCCTGDTIRDVQGVYTTTFTPKCMRVKQQIDGGEVQHEAS